MTHYPYKRQALQKNLGHQNKEKCCYTNSLSQMYPIFKKILNESGEFGYDFMFSSRRELFRKFTKEKQFAIKKFHQTFYVRMECPTCTKPGLKNKVMKKRRWTSQLGNMEVSYILVPIAKFEEIYEKVEQEQFLKKYPYILLFKCHPYRMKCSACKRWGQITFYESVLKALARSFCRQVTEQLDGIKPEKKNWNRSKVLKGHKSELCEACERGVCKTRKR